jgi:hypothetical protein
MVVDDQDGRRHEQIVARRASPRIRGSPVVPISPTQEWRTHWRAPSPPRSFLLQIGTLPGSLRIRARRFDSSRGHHRIPCESLVVDC